ncbi:MAG: hypothetical protein JNM47_14150 [Hyphomonadaceae bacterium]|nr:hypothetical protein [Hyphomonadaceae bacterium]
MTGTFKPAGIAVAAVVAGLAAPVGIVQAADAAMAARDAEADALVAGAMSAGAAEPFGDVAPAEQSNLFDL